MPCTQTGSLEGDRALAFKETKEKLQKENTRLTQLLCLICKEVKDFNRQKFLDGDNCSMFDMPFDVERWYEKHQKIDEENNV